MGNSGFSLFEHLADILSLQHNVELLRVEHRLDPRFDEGDELFDV